MNCYLVLGSNNAVISYAAVYLDEGSAVEAIRQFICLDGVPLSDQTVVSSTKDGEKRRAMYLTLEIDEAKLKNDIYVLVRSIPYLHSTTRARVFYDKQEAQAETDSFNAAVSRSSFHAYLFTFSLDCIA